MLYCDRYVENEVTLCNGYTKTSFMIRYSYDDEWIQLEPWFNLCCRVHMWDTKCTNSLLAWISLRIKEFWFKSLYGISCFWKPHHWKINVNKWRLMWKPLLCMLWEWINWLLMFILVKVIFDFKEFYSNQNYFGSQTILSQNL